MLGLPTNKISKIIINAFSIILIITTTTRLPLLLLLLLAIYNNVFPVLTAEGDTDI